MTRHGGGKAPSSSLLKAKKSFSSLLSLAHLCALGIFSPLKSISPPVYVLELCLCEALCDARTPVLSFVVRAAIF